MDLNSNEKPDEIFNMGFRPALMGQAAELDLKSVVTNIQEENENKIQVLIRGSANIINSYDQFINNNDIWVKKQASKPKYHITQLEEYNRPDTDWNGYQLSLMLEQIYKGLHQANVRVRLTSIEAKLTPEKKNNRVSYGRKQKAVNSKTISYRAILTVILAVVTYVYTGNLVQTSGITIIFSVVATIVYYAHERIWTKIEWS